LITPSVYGGQGGDLGSIKPGDLWSHHHAGPEPARASKNFQTPPVYGGQGGDLGSIKPGDLRSHHLAGLERAKPPVREASCLHSVLKGKEGTSENGGVFDNSPRLRGARGGSWFDQTWRPAVTSPALVSERAKPPVREASFLHRVLKGKEWISVNGLIMTRSAPPT
jgi:hypothetical protein